MTGRRSLCFVAAVFALLFLASASRAEFPKEVTIGDRPIDCRSVEEIRKLGFECEEIPWQENAARVYIDAMNALVPADRDLDRRLDKAAKALDFAGVADEADARFKENAKAFALVKQADAMGPCAFPMHRSRTMAATLLPALAKAQALSRELSYRAALDATRGKIPDAVDGCFVSMRLGQRIGRDPFLISWLVGVSIETRTAETLDRMIAAHGLDDATLKGLAGWLATTRATLDDYPRALRSERTCTLQTVSDMERIGPEAIEGQMTLAERAAWRLAFNPETTRKNVNAFFDFLDAQAKLPAWDALKPENNGTDYVRKHQPEWDFVTRLICPALDKICITNARRLALFEGVEIRCALGRFRLARKSYPKELIELTPAFLKEVPADPYSGKPWRYRLEADGEFTLWSIGEDLKDDDGKPGTQWWTPDAVFTSRKR